MLVRLGKKKDLLQNPLEGGRERERERYPSFDLNEAYVREGPVRTVWNVLEHSEWQPRPPPQELDCIQRVLREHEAVDNRRAEKRSPVRGSEPDMKDFSASTSANVPAGAANVCGKHVQEYGRGFRKWWFTLHIDYIGCTLSIKN